MSPTSHPSNWSVSEEKVAALSTDGKLTGVKEGETEVTAELTFTNGAGEETGKAVAATKVAVKEIPFKTSISFPVNAILSSASSVMLFSLTFTTAVAVNGERQQRLQ